MTGEPDLTEGVSSLAMTEVAEKTEMLFCARTGCAAQTAPCTSSEDVIHQAASSNEESMHMEFCL